MSAALGPGEPGPAIEIVPPDIGRYRNGNTGVPYVTTHDSGTAGPHSVICALIHGNEISGAVALDHLHRHDIRPRCGQLTLIFANTAAYGLFDNDRPHASRYVDEDMNRLWDSDDPAPDRRTIEARRAREIHPFITKASLLLDLHSMQSGARPLHLAGPTAKGRALARRVGGPAAIVSDVGHPNGTRMRDCGPFGTPDTPQNALLTECGPHWHAATADTAIETAYRFLLSAGQLVPDDVPVDLTPGETARSWIEVTDRFVPGTSHAEFTEAFEGLEVVPQAGTVIAHDGDREVCTPYDDCVLVMPARRLVAGQTAVRLGRFRPFNDDDC